MSPPDPLVVTVVRVPLPRFAPRVLVRRKMRAAAAAYEAVPGLLYKAFLIGDDRTFGGLYLWTDRPSAEAWFSPAWHARVERERGAAAEVRWFDAPQVVDRTPGGTPASAVPAVVVLSLGAEAPDVTGLLRAYRLVAPDGASASASLWTTRAAARPHVPPGAEWFEAPVLTPSRLISE